MKLASTFGRRLGGHAHQQAHAVAFGCAHRLERAEEAWREQCALDDEQRAALCRAGGVARHADEAAGVCLAHCGNGELDAAVARARLERRPVAHLAATVQEPLRENQVR